MFIDSCFGMNINPSCRFVLSMSLTQIMKAETTLPSFDI